MLTRHYNKCISQYMQSGFPVILLNIHQLIKDIALSLDEFTN